MIMYWPIILSDANYLGFRIHQHGLLIELEQLTYANMITLQISHLAGVAIQGCGNPPCQIAAPAQFCQELLFANGFLSPTQTGLAIESKLILKQEHIGFQVNV